jgi:hypothetical protein
MKKCARGFDLSEENACSREGVQAGEFELQGREGEFGELVFDTRERGFGDLPQEDQSQVDVFGDGAAGFGEFDCLREACEGLG